MAFHIDITRVERIKNRIDDKSKFAASDNIITVFLRDSVRFEHFVAIDCLISHQCDQSDSFIKSHRAVDFRLNRRYTIKLCKISKS